MGTIAIREQLGSLTPTFMLIFSAPLTLCSNFTTLARVARFVAVEAIEGIGFGINKPTFTFRYPTVISYSFSGVLKVRNRVLVGSFSISLFTVTLWTSITPCSLSSLRISISNMPDNSWQRMSPRDEFSVL